MGILGTFEKIADKFAPQQEQQQQLPNNQQGINNNSYARQYVNNIQYDSRTLGIDVDSDIEYLKNFFRGRRLSKDGNRYIYFKGGQEIMTEAGAEFLLSNHRSMLSISNATTNISDENQIKAVCEEYGGNLTEELCDKHREWKIDKSFFDIVIDNLTNSYMFFLQKSLGDKQRKHMHGTTGPDNNQIQQLPASP